MEYIESMTLYTAMKEMRALGWKHVKHHGTYDLWESTNHGYVQVPNVNIIPKYIEKMIRRG